jgi:hypothetical protein
MQLQFHHSIAGVLHQTKQPFFEFELTPNRVDMPKLVNNLKEEALFGSNLS